MSFFFDRFWFEPGSRMTGVWQWPWLGHDGDHTNHVLFSHVRLGSGQDGSLECDFLSSHLPWAFGGFHGVDASGDPWLLVAQIAPAAATSNLVDSTNPWWPMVDGLDRALHYNLAAEEISSEGLTLDDLHRIYAQTGVDPADIADWPVTDLVVGLLTEFTYVPLTQIVAGRVVNCAFSNIEHDCRHDVFSDVFAAWMAGDLSIPDDTDDDQDDADDVDGLPSRPHRAPPMLSRWRWDKKKIKRWSTNRLRLQAVEDGWSAKKARKASRKKLLKYLTNPHHRRARKRILT